MRVVFIGAGNVANHLAVALHQAGLDICQVYSRTEESAHSLASKVNATYTTHLSDLSNDADVYIYSVSDYALPQIAAQTEHKKGLHIHTSGSTPMNIFDGCAENYGVLYPLQTFSKSRTLDFSTIPVFIEANNNIAQKIISDIANLLTEKIYLADSEARKKLHLSAVFACNFVNHMYEIGTELIKDAGLPFDVLRPLIEETADKIKTLTPYEAQTGPAVRNDENIIEKHLNMLKNKRNLAALYKAVSDDIFSIHQKKQNN